MTAGALPVLDNKIPEGMASISTRLPILSAVRITGFAELLAEPPFTGRADLPAFAEHLYLQGNDLVIRRQRTASSPNWRTT